VIFAVLSLVWLLNTLVWLLFTWFTSSNLTPCLTTEITTLRKRKDTSFDCIFQSGLGALHLLAA
jgi:hypothetical protein